MTRRLTSPVFIGREAELRTVANIRAESVRAGAGATVLVSGEAGIGKSRFSMEIASAAAAGGWTGLRGACDEFSAQRPFAALHGMGATIRDFLAAELPGELETRAWQMVSSTWEMDTSTTPAVASGSIAYQVSQLLQAMARIRPLLVIMDDLHWADESPGLSANGSKQPATSSPSVVSPALRRPACRSGTHSSGKWSTRTSSHRGA